MPLLITDPDLESQLIAQRQATGGDRYDEVWEGVYMMAPLANNEHQSLQARFVTILQSVLGWDSQAVICAGVNVSDRNEDWSHNYRCPDVVVFLPGNRAINRDTHYQGGPDFLVEIVSEKDRSLDKLPFYSAVCVREVLVISRNPWSLQLYRKTDNSPALQLAGTLTLNDGACITSTVLPISLKLIPGPTRPFIELSVTTDPTQQKSWRI